MFARLFIIATLALSVAESLSALGIYRREGLRAVADIWGGVEFIDTQNCLDSERLTEQLLKRLINEELPSETAEQSDVNRIYRFWQMPMYNLDLGLLPVAHEELERERDAFL